MKLYLDRRLVLLLWILILTASHAHGTALKNYQMSGTCQIGNDWIVSIFNTESGHRLWLRTGQSLGTLRFKSFDAATHTATLSYGEEEFRLQLTRPVDSPLDSAKSTAPEHRGLALIEQKVNEYKEGLLLLLADPASGPRTPEAQAKLKQNLANMVTNYRDSLMAEPSGQENAIETSNDSTRRSLIGIKRRNRINSRVWASDHIEKHGVPDQR